MSEIEFPDRYKAMGIPYPDPKTMCQGECEGTGVVPVNFRDSGSGIQVIYSKDDIDKYKSVWEQAEKESPSDDGWHFVQCPDCKGRGQR